MTVFQPPDTDFAERVRASFGRQGIMSLLGARMIRVEPGEVQIELPFRADLTQQHGFFHAGVTSTIADSAGGVEVVDYVEEAKPPAVGKLVADEVERPTLVRAPLNSSTALAHTLEAQHNGRDKNDPKDVRDQISSSGHTGRRTFLYA